jgi:hypothetical protein
MPITLALVVMLAGTMQPFPLTFGDSPAGYRVIEMDDAERARRLALHVWYPAATCVASAPPMTACRDAKPAPGPHPVLVGRDGGGAFVLQAEYLASHGYLVALVASPGARIGGTPEERRQQVAAQLELQRVDIGVALDRATRDLGGDPSRVGVLAASDAALLFAMTTTAVRAITLQDSGVFSDGMSADAARLASSWNPAALRAPLLYFVTRDASTRESRLADFDAMGRTRERIVIDLPGPASHEDLATSGFLRALAGGTDEDKARVRAFVATLEAQHRFFDTHVRDAR